MQPEPCIACNGKVIRRHRSGRAFLNALLCGILGMTGLPSGAASAAEDAACSGPDYRAFDFWLGAWEVYLGDGRRAGRNVIEADAEGCFLTEHWQGITGTRGYSLNYYEPTTSRWRQLWVSPDSVIDIAGAPVEDGMVLEGEIHYRATGEVLPFRAIWSLLADGRVRQFFEEQRQDTWHPWFEGFYTKAVE